MYTVQLLFIIIYACLSMACTYVHAEPLEGDVRLVGSGHSDEEGIVEIYTKYHGWATICTNNWDDKDAAVVCKQLGYDNGGRHNTSR